MEILFQILICGYINSFIGKGNPGTFKPIDADNLFAVCVYFAVKLVIPADWLNDRDQFLYPNTLWENDKLFWADWLAYSLFHGSNNIQSSFGINHWIPFSEEEVGASGLFKSHFMVNFISGKLTPSFPRRRESPNINDNGNITILKETDADTVGDSRLRGNDGESNGNAEKGDKNDNKEKPIEFSEQATDLFTCGRKLWQYYHQEARNDENYLNDASFYDIRKYFQGSRGLAIPWGTGYIVSQSTNPPSADL